MVKDNTIATAKGRTCLQQYIYTFTYRLLIQNSIWDYYKQFKKSSSHEELQKLQTITKIDKISKKLICPQCEQETPEQFKNRIEVLRAKLSASFIQQLAKLKNVKSEVDKISEVFLNHNMVDAKRKIKKELPAVQVLVDTVIDREVEEANRILKSYVDKMLKPWNSLDNRKFDISYLEFEKVYPDLLEQIEEKKKELRENIGNKLKIELAHFYCKLFDL